MAKISIEVVYASKDKQVLKSVDVEEGATIETAILDSKILEDFPEIDLSENKIGVFSKRRKLTDEIFQGERIEIYRPLTMDPMEARRLRAFKK